MSDQFSQTKFNPPSNSVKRSGVGSLRVSRYNGHTMASVLTYRQQPTAWPSVVHLRRYVSINLPR